MDYRGPQNVGTSTAPVTVSSQTKDKRKKTGSPFDAVYGVSSGDIDVVVRTGEARHGLRPFECVVSSPLRA